MQRIVDLVSRLADACRSAVAPHSIDGAAVRAISELLPDTSALILELDPAIGNTRPLAAAQLPGDWPEAVLSVRLAPLLAEVLRHPDGLVRADLPATTAPPALALSATAAVVPDGCEPRRVVVVLAPTASASRALIDAAVQTVRQILAASASIARSDDARMLGVIHRAKREWEQTADALPEIVGLLDSGGRVVRVSRALERWSLGDVRSGTGSDLHGLLHPACTGGCALFDALARALEDTERAGRATFEIADPELGLDLVIVLNAAHDAGHTASLRTAFSVGNVTMLRRAERELLALNRTLEGRVEERTAALMSSNTMLKVEIKRRREAERLLQASHRELELLSEQIVNTQELERQRIAQDLHDSIGQSLSAIKYTLERAQVLIRRGAPHDGIDVIGGAVRRAQRVIAEVRAISMNLRPALLDGLGAASAVRSLCRDWQSTYQDVALEADISVQDHEIPTLLTTTIYRVVQESLHNVARHAHARHVRVSIRLEAGLLGVVVQDDGAGFTVSDEPLPVPPRFGLRGLRERTERSGGRCRLISAPGCGTTVDLQWPIEPGSAAREASRALN